MRPDDALRRTVECSGNLSRPGAVGVHHVQLRVDPRGIGRIVAGVGDELPVGRRCWLLIGAVARGELRHLSAGHVDLVYVALPPAILRILDPVGGEHQRPAVGHPLRGAVVPHAAGQLARRATVGRDDEELVVPVVGESFAVLTIVHARDHSWWLDPLGALGRGGKRDLPVLRVGHLHAEGDRPAVGRPLNVRGRLGQPGHLRHGSFRVHPPHENLRTG